MSIDLTQYTLHVYLPGEVGAVACFQNRHMADILRLMQEAHEKWIVERFEVRLVTFTPM